MSYVDREFVAEEDAVLYEMPVMKQCKTVPGKDDPLSSIIRDAGDASESICVPIFESLDTDQEHMIALYFNQTHKLIGWKRICTGDINSCMVDTQKIVRIALLTGSSAVILSHNHPSGNPKPSKQDIDITKNVDKALSYFRIDLLDHIIMPLDGDGKYGHKYTSLLQEGLM